ncbi:hypothetical protein L249_2134 [Ophiocordyceps polyrhachis-furcata BCC 54312]|uniref:Uncharacterized protein n=1 Tax=Ophiocordyceps polyrhachis-furcata BCC 54312 TaxID=1330021 RepID=A0A367LNX6_9HYPO|nr:hypothetical protein L249_2134 [Ophiocordyceps polyrhachis-furcata BCC 54312]
MLETPGSGGATTHTLSALYLSLSTVRVSPSPRRLGHHRLLFGFIFFFRFKAPTFVPCITKSQLRPVYATGWESPCKKETEGGLLIVLAYGKEKKIHKQERGWVRGRSLKKHNLLQPSDEEEGGGGTEC